MLTDSTYRRLAGDCEVDATRLVESLRELDQQDGIERTTKYDRRRFLLAFRIMRGLGDYPLND